MELLVVIAIIGILIALLLPAVQAAREAARRSQCANHLKQIALGWLLHEDAHQFLPSGGWGYHWVGDPDRGFGHRQSGGWVYSVLPFIEQQALHELGKGLTGLPNRNAATEMVRTPVALFSCPTRRTAKPRQNHYPNFHRNAALCLFVSRTDYGANAGDVHMRRRADPTSVPMTSSRRCGPQSGSAI